VTSRLSVVTIAAAANAMAYPASTSPPPHCGRGRAGPQPGTDTAEKLELLRVLGREKFAGPREVR
jgi:hypothetical protein